ncbi:iron complex transport system permease protein [Catenulispora sp. EB89]|uniref:FecCD family ABC transporter permease n=1 Tax=Catenulispora sp. EB89 TaxID=3156257 RepID=UPI0035180C8E
MSAPVAPVRRTDREDHRDRDDSVSALTIARRRTLALCAACLALLVALVGVALSTGQFHIPFFDALRALFGAGDSATVLVVQQFRAPRVIAALVAGAALAVAGSMTQRLLRNPLASPDVIGVTGGASVGAVLVLAVGSVPAAFTPVAAVAGGLLVAALLGASAWRSRVSVTRLVLVGVAIQQGLAAVVNLMIVRFPEELAGQALQWTSGSLYGRTWAEIWIAGGAIVVVGAGAALMQRHVAVLDLGDESAGGLGLDPRRSRLGLLLLAVVLASLAAALAGPVGFVALVVPHIVRRLAGPPTAATLALTALTGALLLLAADYVALNLLPIRGLPAGTVTATLGAPWLLWLMARSQRRNLT